MPSGSPLTSSLTAPQKHSPLCVAMSTPVSSAAQVYLEVKCCNKPARLCCACVQWTHERRSDHKGAAPNSEARSTAECNKVARSISLTGWWRLQPANQESAKALG